MFENFLYFNILFQFRMETFFKAFKNSFSARKMFPLSSNTLCVFCSFLSEGEFSSQKNSLVYHPWYFKIGNSKQEMSNSYTDILNILENHVGLYINTWEFSEYANYYSLVFSTFKTEMLSFCFLFFGCVFQLDCKFLEERIVQGCIFLQG